MILIGMLCSCDGNYRHVIVSGVVKDSLTGVGVSHASVNITCWVYDTDIWASKKIVRDTVSDENGKFSFLFDKGEAFDIKIEHEQYKELQYSQTLDRSIVNDLEFKLQTSN